MKYPNKIKLKDLQQIPGYLLGGCLEAFLIPNIDFYKWNSVDFIFDIKLNRIIAVYCSEEDPCLPEEYMIKVFQHIENYKKDAAALTLINLGVLEKQIEKQLGIKLPDTLAQELFKEVY